MDNKDLPAFPDPQRGSQQSFSNQSPRDSPTGMTKREFFAAIAAQGLATNWDRSNDDVAMNAVRIADALLSELSKPQ